MVVLENGDQPTERFGAPRRRPPTRIRRAFGRISSVSQGRLWGTTKHPHPATRRQSRNLKQPIGNRLFVGGVDSSLVASGLFEPSSIT